MAATHARAAVAASAITKAVVSVVLNIIWVYHAKGGRAATGSCSVALVGVLDSLGISNGDVGTP